METNSKALFWQFDDGSRWSLLPLLPLDRKFVFTTSASWKNQCFIRRVMQSVFNHFGKLCAHHQKMSESTGTDWFPWILMIFVKNYSILLCNKFGYLVRLWSTSTLTLRLIDFESTNCVIHSIDVYSTLRKEDETNCIRSGFKGCWTDRWNEDFPIKAICVHISVMKKFKCYSILILS